MASKTAAIQRVAFFSPGWPAGAYPNGVVTYVANMRAGLRAHGVDSAVVAVETKPHPDGDDVIAALGLVSRTRLRNRALNALLGRTLPHLGGRVRAVQDIVGALRALSARHPIDLFEMEEAFGIVEYVRRRVPCPVVMRLHGPWFLNGVANGAPQDADFFRRDRGERYAAERALAVTSPSRDVLDRVRERWGLELKDAEVIPNPGVVIPAEQRWRYDACDKNELLFVGRFDRHKAGDLVIDAFARLAPRFPELRLTFAGPDRGIVDDAGRRYDLPQYLESRLPDRAVRARVNALGPQGHAQIEALRRRAFVTVIASRYENFPMVALEAASFGSPVVASDAGGIPEIVQDGKTGLLFKAGDAGDLAAKVALLLEDHARAASLGETAAALFADRFAPEAIARRTLAFYDRVLSKRR